MKGDRIPGRERCIGFLKEEMKNKELKEYLNRFPDDADVSIVLANPRKRKRYEVVNVTAITDIGQPAFLIDVGNELDMDAEMIAACEEDERNSGNPEGLMEITDFPEVMP